MLQRRNQNVAEGSKVVIGLEYLQFSCSAMSHQAIHLPAMGYDVLFLHYLKFILMDLRKIWF